MKNIKPFYQILKRILQVVFWGMFAIIMAGFLFFACDRVAGCIEAGGVWDGAEKRCRYDCLTWNEKDGCVLLM